MNSISRSIRRRGGLAATFELHEDGHGRAALSAAAASGAVIRVRQGWYATPEIDPTLLEAVRVGGRLTCLSALDYYGYWTYPTADLHVAVDPHACRLRSRRSKITRLVDVDRPRTRVHWRDVHAGGDRFVLSPVACLADLLVCADVEVVSAVAGSVLHLSPELAPAWHDLVRQAPFAKREPLAAVDGVCESGTESLFLMRMARFQLPLRRQVRIPSVGRVDFLVGTKLVIEIDGAEYHTDPAKFEDDRRRDAMLSQLGYRVLRFSYRQVLYAWAEVEAAVMGAIARGDHF
jgi:very-short-patch-repair endonuclease